MTASVTTDGTTPATVPDVPDEQVHALRAFNRFYTRRAGVLDPYLSSNLSLTDVRVLYELANAPNDAPLVATDIAREMGIDTGYLSRILKRFDTAGWIARSPNPRDQRQSLLSLTDKGREAYAPLNDKSHAYAAGILASLSSADRERFVGAMNTIENLLTAPANETGSAKETPDSTRESTPAPTPAPAPAPAAEVSAPRTAILRDLRPGDLGWILQAHGEIYAAEWGFNAAFESVCADVIAACAKLDPACERGWIAEVDGVRVGNIFLVQSGKPGIAKIRLLLLTKDARGLGLGSRLVDACIAFAREKGYAGIELWTQNILTAARGIYARRGFRLVGTDAPGDKFGPLMTGEHWAMDL